MDLQFNPGDPDVEECARAILVRAQGPTVDYQSWMDEDPTFLLLDDAKAQLDELLNPTTDR